MNKIIVKEFKGNHLIELEGTIDYDVASKVYGYLSYLSFREHRKIFLDFSGVDSFNGDALADLVNSICHFIFREVDIYLFGMNGSILDLLNIAGMRKERIFPHSRVDFPDGEAKADILYEAPSSPDDENIMRHGDLEGKRNLWDRMKNWKVF